jgi:tight adherence protein C
MPAFSPDTLRLAGFLAIFVGLGGTIFVLLTEVKRSAAIREALQEVTEQEGTDGSGALGAVGTVFSERVLHPLARQIARLVYRLAPEGASDQTRQRLVQAGLSDRLSSDMFFALSVAAPVVAFVVIYLTGNVLGRIPTMLWVFVPAAMFAPKMWLTSKVEARQHQIKLALPDTLDLLTIAVEAGLGFDAALGRVVGSVQGPLSDELYRMLQELRIGVPRNEALKSLSERTGVDSLDQFITAINQADTFGIAIGTVLRVQSSQLRKRRSQEAEERAAKTPVKLLFPLLVCIFPGLFTVLVGPAAIKIMETMFK